MTGNPQEPTQPIEPTLDPNPAEPNGNAEPPAEPNGAQNPTDWKAWSRHWEDQSKANKKEADDAKARAEAAEAKLAEMEGAAAELAQLKAANERRANVDAIAAEIGVSAAVLARMQGDTAEEIRANAQFLQSTVPIYPAVPQGGTPAAPTVTRESILAIENERERLQAIQDNIDLF